MSLILKIDDIIIHTKFHINRYYFKVCELPGPRKVFAHDLAVKNLVTGEIRLDIDKRSGISNLKMENNNWSDTWYGYIKLASQEDIFIINKLLTFQ